MQRAATNPPTLEETQLAIQEFFELDTEQTDAVMTMLAEETALAQKESQSAAQKVRAKNGFRGIGMNK